MTEKKKLIRTKLDVNTQGKNKTTLFKINSLS
jgi:hypothetical protein